jgi:hypothetical protein
MRISFPIFCLFIIVTLVHFAIVAGVTRLGEGPAKFLSTVDSEAILENWLSPEMEQPSDPELQMVESIEEAKSEGESSPDFPVFSRTEVARAQEKPEEDSAVESESAPEFGKKTAESEEYSAIVDARLLAGRVESPNPSDYFRNAAARHRKKIENPTQAEPVRAKPIQAEPVQAEPIQAEPVRVKPIQAEPIQAEPIQAEPIQAEPKAQKRPAPPVKVEKEEPKTAPRTDGPHKIRPIGG